MPERASASRAGDGMMAVMRQGIAKGTLAGVLESIVIS
jgi:hypothetical protein